MRRKLTINMGNKKGSCKSYFENGSGSRKLKMILTKMKLYYLCALKKRRPHYGGVAQMVRAQDS